MVALYIVWGKGLFRYLLIELFLKSPFPQNEKSIKIIQPPYELIRIHQNK